MRFLESFAVVLVVALLFFIALLGRRELFARGRGAVELYFRLHHRPGGGGWSPGFAQFHGDEMRWFRVFSLAFRPRRRLSRRGLVNDGRRVPTAEEAQLIPAEWVVLQCHSDGKLVELAMPRHTVAGFLSWLESATPYST
jgi:hypothetical protein